MSIRPTTNASSRAAHRRLAPVVVRLIPRRCATTEQGLTRSPRHLHHGNVLGRRLPLKRPRQVGRYRVAISPEPAGYRSCNAFPGPGDWGQCSGFRSVRLWGASELRLSIHPGVVRMRRILFQRLAQEVAQRRLDVHCRSRQGFPPAGELGHRSSGAGDPSRGRLRGGRLGARASQRRPVGLPGRSPPLGDDGVVQQGLRESAWRPPSRSSHG